MYTITTGGASAQTPKSRSRSGFRSSRESSFIPQGRSFSHSPRKRFGGNRGRFDRPSRPFDAKRAFKKDYIDEKLFINKEVTVSEAVDYTPANTFSDFSVAPQLLANLTAKGFTNPSPVQDQAIPVALQGKDVIGIASTGTGKTAAFLIPLINKLVADNNQKILVLTPTRELALQVEAEFIAFTRGMKLFSVSCVGGAPIMRQIKELELGVHAVIGTPGRVKDLMERGKLNVSFFDSVVLDEADRMLDMGFIDDMRFILAKMPQSKQSLFFSATFSKEIKALCSDFMKDPVTVSIKTRDTATSVAQDIVRASTDTEKLDALHDILLRPEAKKVLIFREMKRHTDKLADELTARGFKALALHGDMHNRERERAVRALTTGRVQVVIATDVAARGIDIPDISLVINYDIPNNYETYIHRIGRTGRGTKLGHALTFVPNKEHARRG